MGGFHNGARSNRTINKMTLYKRPLVNVRGYGLIPMYKGQLRQRGYGVGGLFSSLLKLLQPVVKKGLSTITKVGKKFVTSDVVKSIGKDVKKSLLKSGKNIVADALEGKNIKESISKQLEEQQEMLNQQVKKLRSAGADIIRGESEKKPARKRPIKVKKIKVAKRAKKIKNNNNNKLFKKNADIFTVY
jgi:predicted peroxiredoxin